MRHAPPERMLLLFRAHLTIEHTVSENYDKSAIAHRLHGMPYDPNCGGFYRLLRMLSGIREMLAGYAYCFLSRANDLLGDLSVSSLACSDPA